MPLIVQKFGGSSVATPEKILRAARRAIRAQQEGNQVVMVVSAMGDTTDDLIDLARQITDRPPAREMDMLLSTGEQVSCALMAMAIHSLGHKAVSMTGAQIGVRTDASFRKARIKSIETGRLKVVKHRCHGLLAEAKLYRYDTDKDGKAKGEVPVDEHNHAMAALRYLISRLDARFLAKWQRQHSKGQAPLEEAPPDTDETAELVFGARPRRPRNRLWDNPDCWTSLN